MSRCHLGEKYEKGKEKKGGKCKRRTKRERNKENAEGKKRK
jgi:hypothetical protein